MTQNHRPFKVPVGRWTHRGDPDGLVGFPPGKESISHPGKFGKSSTQKCLWRGWFSKVSYFYLTLLVDLNHQLVKLSTKHPSRDSNIYHITMIFVVDNFFSRLCTCRNTGDVMREKEPQALPCSLFIRLACFFFSVIYLQYFSTLSKNHGPRPKKRWPKANKNPPGPGGSGWTHFRGSIERGEVVGFFSSVKVPGSFVAVGDCFFFFWRLLVKRILPGASSRDLFITHLEVTWLLKGSLNHPKKGTKNCLVVFFHFF